MSEESEKRREKLEDLREARYQWHEQELREHLVYVMETQIKILEWIELHEEAADQGLFGTNIRRNSLFR